MISRHDILCNFIFALQIKEDRIYDDNLKELITQLEKLILQFDKEYSIWKEGEDFKQNFCVSQNLTDMERRRMFSPTAEYGEKIVMNASKMLFRILIKIELKDFSPKVMYLIIKNLSEASDRFTIPLVLTLMHKLCLAYVLFSVRIYVFKSVR